MIDARIICVMSRLVGLIEHTLSMQEIEDQSSVKHEQMTWEILSNAIYEHKTRFNDIKEKQNSLEGINSYELECTETPFENCNSIVLYQRLIQPVNNSWLDQLTTHTWNYIQVIFNENDQTYGIRHKIEKQPMLTTNENYRLTENITTIAVPDIENRFKIAEVWNAIRSKLR